MSHTTIFSSKKIIHTIMALLIITLVPCDLIQARGGGGHGGGGHGGGGGGMRHGGGSHAAAHRSGGHHAAAHHNNGHHNNGHHNYNHNGNRGWRGGYYRNGYGWGYWGIDGLWIALTAAQIAALSDGGYSEETTYIDDNYDDEPEDAFVDVY